MHRLHSFAITLVVGGLIGSQAVPELRAEGAIAWNAPPELIDGPSFWAVRWYERQDAQNAPIAVTRRLRINGPEAASDERWRDRQETHDTGLALIGSGVDLAHIAHAEIYAELWGGHPGVHRKTVALNGRVTLPMPEVGAQWGNCVYSYPSVATPISALVRETNALQWGLDSGDTFWGHAMVDQIALRMALTAEGAQAQAPARSAWRPELAIERDAEGDGFRIRLVGPAPSDHWHRVTFQGYYRGYDDDGDEAERGWHGFTKDRKPVNTLGVSVTAPHIGYWDTSLLPAQENVAVRALIEWDDGFTLLSEPVRGLRIPPRAGASVRLFRPQSLPVPFWSRAGNEKTCDIPMDVDPGSIEAATLYLKIWTGGPGTVEAPITLNGHMLPLGHGHEHHVDFQAIALDPSWLQRGTNRIRVLSDTTHHGIEVFLPGPAIIARISETETP